MLAFATPVALAAPATTLAAPGEASLSLASPFTEAAVPSPEELAADSQSRVAFVELHREAAVALAQKTFHIDRPSWTPPGSDDGAHISKYLGESSALEALPNGKHVVVSSTTPLRAEGKAGLAPVSMTLHEEGESLAPTNPLVPVRIAKHASGGMTFASGITVTPAASTSEAPTITGNSVVFANSAPDTDVMIEPVPQGAELSWQLRSQQSPQSDAVDFSLPLGAHLQMSTEVPGGAEVIEGGQTLMAIPPAVAVGADGRSVSVAYSVSGSTLTTHVDLSGPVDFPVLVDPLFVGAYGAANGANVWSGWIHGDSCGGCFGFLEFANLIQIGANPGPGIGNYGELMIFAPHAGLPGGAGITRVDLSGVTHEALNQSYIEAGIVSSSGPNPVYSLNGLAGASGPSPLASSGVYSNQPMAFCAQGAGGHDGGGQPLCDENFQGNSFFFRDRLGPNAPTVFNYVRMSGAQITYDDNTPPNDVKWESGQGAGWVQYGPSNAHITASDQGLGVQRFEVQLPPGNATPTAKQELPCNAPNGFTGCPETATSEPLNLQPLASGIYEVGAAAVDAAGNATLQGAGPPSNYPKLYIDHIAPELAALSGTLAEANNTTIGNGKYTLHFSATDGSPAAPQSGVDEIKVQVDGREAYTATTTCPLPTEVPTSGCFALSGEWAMSGQTFGDGRHTVTVTARDWAGNISASRSLIVTVNEAQHIAVGPGAVDLGTGNYGLSATDVSIAAGGATLSLARSYDSRAPYDWDSPLGGQWRLSLPDGASAGWQSLTPLSEGSVSVYTSDGQQLIFSPKTGGGWTSPEGYGTYVLSEPSTSPAIYQITDASGNYTKFTQTATGASFMPSTVAQAAGAGGLNKVTYSYKVTSQGFVEPARVLGPEPSEGACATTLVKGCRALSFEYSTALSATGEGRTEWGNVPELLRRVFLIAWDPAKDEMTETAVAQYEYNSEGRLTAEWDPRISPALKTTYGYDTEGDLTALTPPGQEGWTFHYGTIGGDAAAGRLLSVARASASAEPWNGELPKNTVVPTLSGSPKQGTKMTVSNGTWSASPIAYSYQWIDCVVPFGACEPILGATNPSYVVGAGDVGHALFVQVTATNSGGTEMAVTARSAVVSTGAGTEGTTPPAPGPRWTIEYRVPVSGTGLPELTSTKIATWGQTDKPTEGTAIFPPDETQSWPATDYKRASIYYLDERNRTVNVASPGGGISTAEYDSYNNAIRTLSADNRATALASGAKSLETAEALDTESTYGEEGTELKIQLGPQHNVRLPDGSEVLARKRTVYSYDEGAPAGGPYRLVTKTTESAQPVGSQEKDIRTVTNSYSGQEGLGWKLHAPTSSTADPSGADLVHKTVYDPTTGAVREDTSPAGNSESVYPPSYSSTIGAGEGSGSGQFSGAAGTATDASGNLWVVDRGGDRVEKFSPSGTFIAAYGSKGSGNLQFLNPWGIAINQSTGNVYVADADNHRIEELSSSGTYVGSFGNSESLKEPLGVAIDPSGNVWATDWEGNKLAEFSSTGGLLKTVVSIPGAGGLSGPIGITISEGGIYVIDSGNSRIVQYSLEGHQLNTFGSKGSHAGQFESPEAIAANPSTGNIYVTDTYNYRVQEFSPAGRSLAEWGTWGSSHPSSYPTGIAIKANGQILVSDQFADKVSSWTPPEAGAQKLSYASQFGSSGASTGHFNTPIGSAIDGEGDIWISDYGNDRIQKFSPTGTFIAAYGSEGSGNSQFFGPGGIDINQATGNVYVSDSGNGRIEQFSTSGTFVRAFGTSGSGKLTRPGGLKVDSAGNVWVADMNANKVFEYSSTGTFIAAYGSEGSGNLQFKTPVAVTSSGENVYITDSGNHRIQEMTNKGVFVRQWGGEGEGSGEFYAPEGIAADAAGNLYVVDDGASHVEEFSSTGAYKATFATKGSEQGQLNAPAGASIDAAGNMIVVDTNDNRVEKWTAVNQAAHDTKTIYYSSAANSEFPGCGGHAEWAGLPCQAQPAQQPQGRGLPNLPVTTYTYNVFDEPLSTTDTVGSTTRTTTIGYDGAGRTLTDAISSSVGTSVPTTTDKYSETTGALIEGSTSTKSIKEKYNTLGQLESYTDADGNTSTYTYDVDGRPEKANDGKGTQTYGYDLTTGSLTSVKDSAAGTFTGIYDVEGNLTAKGYPNGMSANYVLDPTGQPTSLEYIKTTHCISGCTWYSDHVVPSIHEQWLSQTSSLAKESYAYDGTGRLTETQETPVGKGCTTRLYTLDEDGNRTALTTRPPGAEGKCTTEGGTIERHIYDEGDRLAEEGVSYDAFGNTTAIPASDAGGAALTSAFYADNALASQKQNGETIAYGLDPAGRTRETVSTGTTNETVVSHYAGGGDSPAWTVNGSGVWTRYIDGLGGLAAIQANGGTPVLQLENLHGDIIAKAALSETETKLLSSAETTEFGVATSTPAKYSWLGADQRPTETPTVTIAMGARTYVPQLGRFEQSDPQPGGSSDAYAYTTGDPVNSSDPSGETVTYNYEAASTEAARTGLSEHYIVPGALMPPPVNLQIEAEFNAHPPWDAASANVSGGGATGSGRFRDMEDPGLPRAAICNTRPPSKWGSYKAYCEKYKKEEGSPLEPAETLCDIAAFTPWGAPCRVLIPIQVASKLHR